MEDRVKESLIIVSGVPRSGTSLMMRILRDSGVPVTSDEGWSFELKDVARLSRSISSTMFLFNIPKGHAIKVLYPPFTLLPTVGIKYTVIWMRRNGKECAKSLRKLGNRPRSYIAKAAKNINMINKGVPASMRGKSHITGLVTVKFEELIRNTTRTLSRVEDLLGVDLVSTCVVDRDPAFSNLPLGELETQ